MAIYVINPLMSEEMMTCSSLCNASPQSISVRMCNPHSIVPFTAQPPDHHCMNFKSAFSLHPI